MSKEVSELKVGRTCQLSWQMFKKLISLAHLSSVSTNAHKCNYYRHIKFVFQPAKKIYTYIYHFCPGNILPGLWGKLSFGNCVLHLVHVKLQYFKHLGGCVSNEKYSLWPPKPTSCWLTQYRQWLVLIFVCMGLVWPALKSIKVLLLSSLAAGLDFLFILLFLSVI